MDLVNLTSIVSDMKKIFLLLFLLPALSFGQETKVKNVILLIGDGMGLSQVSTAFYYNNNVAPNFAKFKHIGLINTSSAREKITDSAAGATAFATGTRSYNGAISVDTNKKSLPTILEYAEKKDVKTGLVATSSIVHATPASFYAHVDSRSKYEDIAKFLPKSGVDFFAGGGLKFFNKRSDGSDYFTELIKKGYQMDTTVLSNDLKLNIAKKYGFLLAEDGMDSKLEGRGDFLREATDLALRYLTKSETGFFLMIEGSQIDWEGHACNTEGIIQEVKDFDRAIGEAINFASVNANTLVIVTADHETGGFALSPKGEKGSWNSNELDPKFYQGADNEEYSYAAHTATLIPVFAYGAGAEEFMGIYDNNEIFHKIMKLTRWSEPIEKRELKNVDPSVVPVKIDPYKRER